MLRLYSESPRFKVAWRLETSPVKRKKTGGLIPPKVQTQSMGNSPYVLRNAMNPTG